MSSRGCKSCGVIGIYVSFWFVSIKLGWTGQRGRQTGQDRIGRGHQRLLCCISFREAAFSVTYQVTSLFINIRLFLFPQQMWPRDTLSPLSLYPLDSPTHPTTVVALQQTMPPNWSHINTITHVFSPKTTPQKSQHQVSIDWVDCGRSGFCIYLHHHQVWNRLRFACFDSCIQSLEVAEELEIFFEKLPINHVKGLVILKRAWIVLK